MEIQMDHNDNNLVARLFLGDISQQPTIGIKNELACQPGYCSWTDHIKQWHTNLRKHDSHPSNIFISYL